MEQLIAINIDDNHNPVVSGRQLHEALKVKTRYDNWFSRMTEYGFTENQDYLVASIFGHNSNGGRQSKVDHIINLDMAKEIAMIQRSDKGKEVRKYFIQVEKDFNSPEKIMARALLMADKNIKALTDENEKLMIELEEAQSRASYLDLIIDCKDSITTTQIAQDYGMTAIKMNQLLKKLGIQRQVNSQWILYSKYQGKGYIGSKTFSYEDRNGNHHTKINTVWTQKGRLFLYEKLKENKVLPLIEVE